MKHKPIIIVLSVLVALLCAITAVLGVMYIKEKKQVHVPDSTPLVDLSVDLSRCETDGVVEYTLTNNSFLGFGFERFQYFVFKDNKWQETGDGDYESKYEYYRYYQIDAGQILTNEMPVTAFEPGEKYMIVVGPLIGLQFSDGEYDGYYATAVFEVPEREE